MWTECWFPVVSNHTKSQRISVFPFWRVAPGLFWSKGFEYSSQLCMSNKSISRRIKIMAEDVEHQLIRIIHQTNFALQLDETLTHECEALLIVYVRHVSFIIDSLCDEFLFWDFLGVNAASETIFNTWPSDAWGWWGHASSSSSGESNFPVGEKFVILPKNHTNSLAVQR